MPSIRHRKATGLFVCLLAFNAWCACAFLNGNSLTVLKKIKSFILRLVDKKLPHYSCIDVILVSPFVSFTSSNCALNDVSIVQKFGSWPEDDKGIGKRMPYLSSDGNLLLSTCDCKSGSTFGTVVSQAAEYHPAHWTSGDAENPGIIWFWVKESSTMLQGMVHT